MRFRGVCYRGHDPRWAFAPTSGLGAATTGGRFNPVGQPALYLSLTWDGVWLEITQGFAHRLPPITVRAYDVDVDDILDLRTHAVREAASVPLADLACAWKLDQSNGRTPRSWTLAWRLINSGYAGILTPSFANGANAAISNLVL